MKIRQEVLRLAFLPTLLHLHQDQLDFLISFFGGKGPSLDQSPGLRQDLDGSRMFPTKSSNFRGHTIAEEALLPYFQASGCKSALFIVYILLHHYYYWSA
ncbi:hypothetical protein HHK36_009944 [Tetracentron sinense]|uniref:Autophagy-related protein 2 n=1 Tax=Tetracentron sinense TaxID=13715 RepID=A0A835DLT4_TETSI|nr:hypothetical protein HHK36_009944 [Tetracentron sinense]